MPNNNLILRSVVSPWITPTPDFTRNSVLSFSDVDNNFIYLKGELINSIETSGNTITLKKINGNDLSFNVGSGGGNTYWTSGSTGFYSIKTINDSGLDATGNYSVASGFNTLASGNVSFTHSTNSTASSDYTSILGGQNNEITPSSNNSSIVGGTGNTIGGSINGHILGGYDNSVNKNSDLSVVIAGSGNTIGNGSTYSSIINGFGNEIGISNHSHSSILGGQNNQIGSTESNNASIIGGDSNLVQGGDNSTLIGGSGNTLTNPTRSSIINGLNNTINSSDGLAFITDSNIIGGEGNLIRRAGKRSVIIGGSGNTITGYESGGNINNRDNAIIGGVENTINYIRRSAIIGGTNNFIQAEAGIMNSVIIGGKNNSMPFTVGDEDGSVIVGGHNNTIGGFGSGDPIISSIIGGSGNTIDDIVNAHIIGTFDVTATTENTLYVPNLEVRGQAYTPVYDNLTGGTTFIPDWDNSNVQILTLSGNTNVSGGTSTMKGGSAYTMIIKQSNGGSHTITWDTSVYKWEAGSAPTLSVADGSVDIITFICDGTSLYGLIAKDFQ